MALDHILGAAERDDGTVDDDGYTRFRSGLLRHIAMEEKVLLPFARTKNGAPLAPAAQLRADHGAIAKLLVRSPTRAIVDALQRILSTHDVLEEGERGLYATCDTLARDEG